MVVLYMVMGAVMGLFGSLVGLGGGVFLVPVLTLFLGVPIQVAVAASLAAVICTSTSAAVGYLRRDLSNVRLGMLLEVGTTVGAVCGGLLGTTLGRETLSGIFGVTLLVMAAYLFRGRGSAQARIVEPSATTRVSGRYHDPSHGEEVRYGVQRIPWGLGASVVAGGLSGLLGIGGGVIKVPAMTLLMGVPAKAAVATSNFMIGVTACASAYLYYSRGFVDPAITVPVVLGVTVGAITGSRLVPRIRNTYLLSALSVVLMVFAVQMLLAAFGIRVR